jgi:flagellar biosynthesis protein FlhG
MDQADTLRRLMEERQSKVQNTKPRKYRSHDDGRPGPRVLTVASGKGGVGKSCFVANMGTMLARQGFKVLLVDCDFGLANLDIILNVQPSATLEQVLDGTATIQEAVVGVEPNLWLIPAVSGLMDGVLKTEDALNRERLLDLLERFPWEMDFILMDIGAGIQPNVLSLHHPTFESLVVITPEPTSLTDAYGLIKMLKRHVGITRANVIVNQVTDGREGVRVFQRLNDVAKRFIDVELEYIGHWQKDEKITEAVIKRKILLDLNEGALSVPSLKLLAKRVQSLGQNVDKSRLGPISAATPHEAESRDRKVPHGC